MQTNLRKWLSLLSAILTYYVIHEGAHVLVACLMGAFETVRFLGVGVQVVINDTLLTPTQLAIFCLVGSAAALAAGWIFAGVSGRITQSRSKYLKALGFYATLVLLFADPIYLSVLYRFVGGGDMNGILLFGVPEIAVQAMYGLTGLCNLLWFLKKILPAYKAAFA